MKTIKSLMKAGLGYCTISVCASFVRTSAAMLMLSTAILAASTAFAADKPPKPAEDKDVQLSSMTDKDQRIFIDVVEKLRATDFNKGIIKSIWGEEFLVGVRRYLVEYRATANNREWYLLPVVKINQGTERSSTFVADAAFSHPSCKLLITDYMAIDSQTLKAEPYAFKVYNDVCKKSIDGKWNKPLKLLDSGTFVIVDEDIILAEQRAQFDAARDAQYELSTKQAPLKRKIGTKLCRVQRDVTYVGFTEAVSPDQDRIQIRVVSAFRALLGAAPDFREQILWDDPANWNLCQ